MNRYKDISNGFIKYPSGWENTGEGGLITHLYVLDHKDYDKRWEECIDDVEFWNEPDLIRFGDKHKGWYQGSEELNCATDDDIGKPILLAMKFASTGKSLWDGMDYFTPGEKDLTEEGKQFIELLQKLYSGRRILIQTTLDT